MIGIQREKITKYCTLHKKLKDFLADQGIPDAVPLSTSLN
jgi:hypothetical protein